MAIGTNGGNADARSAYTQSHILITILDYLQIRLEITECMCILQTILQRLWSWL